MEVSINFSGERWKTLLSGGLQLKDLICAWTEAVYLGNQTFTLARKKLVLSLRIFQNINSRISFTLNKISSYENLTRILPYKWQGVDTPLTPQIFVSSGHCTCALYFLKIYKNQFILKLQNPVHIYRRVYQWVVCCTVRWCIVYYCTVAEIT